MDELDRILSTERSVTPSPDFAHSVMRAVRHEATAPPAIPFPWRRMMPIIAAAAVLIVAVLFSLPYSPTAGPSPIADSATMRQLLAAFATLPIGYLTAALIGSLVTVRLSLRMTSD